MPLILRLIVALLLMSLPASANFGLGGHGGPGSGAAPQTISSVPLSGTTFPPGASSGTVVGTIGTPVMSPASPAFSGSCCTLNSGDFASFQIVGSNLETNGVLCGSPPCTYHFNVRATQGGISNSPFDQAVTITSSNAVGSMSFVNNGSGTSPGPSGMTPVHFEKTFAPGDVPVGSIAVPSVGGTPIAYGVDCAADGVNPLRTDGCPSWADGSLRGIPVSAFQPQLTAGNTGQIVWNTQSGSYSTTSAIRPADIVSRSEYLSKLTGVNNSWVPQPYGVWPNGVQIGCAVSGGSVSGCTLRVSPPSAAGGGPGTCLSYPYSYSPGQAFTAKIDNGSGSPGNILTITAGSGLVAQANWLRGDIISDAGYPSGAIAPNTVATALTSGSGGVGSTFTVSGAPQLVAAEQMGLIGCSGRVNAGVNGLTFATPAIFTTTLGSNDLPTGITLVTGGSGYSVVGSGALTFDVNTLLNLYGTVDPPTCAAELGAGVFSSVTYSAGAVTVNTTTSGHIATGQILKDSTGATAIVTGTSSPWAISTNTGGSATLTSGAMTANTPVCIHSANPVEKGYWMFGPYIDPNTGIPDPQLMGSAEADLWSLSGTPYSVRAIIRTDREGWQPGSWYQSYTYNADIMNGTAEIRGNAQGTGVFTNLTDENPGDWWSADPALTGPTGASARMDWLGVTPNTFSESNNLAINAVNPYLAVGSELAYWRASKATLPLVGSLTPTPAVVPTSTTNGNWDNPSNFLAYYVPFGPSYLDGQSTYGSGGNHDFLTPQGSQLSFWIDVQGKASDRGISRLQQMRVSGLELSGDVAGESETTTEHALNVDPGYSDASYTDPVRLFSRIYSNGNGGLYIASGVPSVQQAVGGQVNVHGDIADDTHWPSGSLLGPYLIDGEYYQLKQMDLMAAQAMGTEVDDGLRRVTFGGTTQYGILWNDSATRAFAWGMALINQFKTWAPPAEPDVKYWTYIANTDEYAHNAAIFPYTGSFTIGSGATGTKNNDWTAAGGCTSPAPTKLKNPAPFSVGETQWMCSYLAQELLLDQLWQEPGTNANLDFLVAEVVDKYLVKDGSQNSCVFNAINYAELTGDTTTQAPNTSRDNTDIPGSPPGSVGQVYRGFPFPLASVAGQSTITFTPTNGGTAGWPAPLPSGSILRPTQWDTTDEFAGAPAVPTPLNTATWYTWCSTSSISPFTGTINPYGTNCASPSPITMTATVPQWNAGWIVNASCPTGTDTWGETGGLGATPSYAAALWAVLNWAAAVNGPSSDRTAAISLFSPTMSPGSVWPAQPNWDACTSFSC